MSNENEWRFVYRIVNDNQRARIMTITTTENMTTISITEKTKKKYKKTKDDSGIIVIIKKMSVLGRVDCWKS
jgi:hypothetical protein